MHQRFIGRPPTDLSGGSGGQRDATHYGTGTPWAVLEIDFGASDFLRSMHLIQNCGALEVPMRPWAA